MPCVAALAPTVVSCVGAAAQEGANPISDAACLAGAVNAAVNLPASCDTCLEEFDVKGKVKAAASKVEDAAGDVEDEVGSVAGEIGDKIGSVF
ncbi:hypothetical protein DXG01_016031 [Tephrocybe rancida]|nr:hypothetical protein DXG01_016031 [Tephrocybe rancida]